MDLELKQLITNCKQPLVFNEHLNWNILKWDLNKWNEVINDTELQFRMGVQMHTQNPQWENTCEIVKGSFQDFISFNQEDKWLYFDYKYLNQWFIDKHELQNAVDWSKFGFPDIKSNGSTIWIGSEGAHTPCHVDTYGCNLVAQIMGRKLWLLFPPHNDLKATRVPYEESTIYSSINFYSPQDIKLDTSECHKVILHPGQVLLVPNGWWHYVENLDTAISVNTWIPLKNDDSKRIDEALTLLMVKCLTSSLKTEEQRSIYSNNDLNDVSVMGAINLLETCFDRDCIAESSEVEVPECDSILKLESLTCSELNEFLREQSERFNGKTHKAKSFQCEKVEKYLKAFTDREVIKLLRSKLSENT